MKWKAKQKKRNREKNGSWIVYLTSLIIVSLFCVGGTHILVGVDATFPMYVANINGNTQYVDTGVVLEYERQFIPPYGSTVVDSMGILEFTVSDSSGIVIIWGVADSGIDIDPWTPEDDIPDECLSCSVGIYNVAGQRISEYTLDIEGCLGYIWDGRDSSGQVVASGVYFVRLQCEEVVYRKVMILK
jgi:hypothetical protein